MTRKCCVPGCRGNYDTNEKVSVFSFPTDADRRRLWLSKIPRENFEPSSQSVVCEKHFSEKFVLRSDSVARPDGSILTVERARPKLSEDAYPSIFPNCPSSMSEEPPTKRKMPFRHMAFPDQPVMSEVKIEMDVAEDPEPPWRTQEQCSESMDRWFEVNDKTAAKALQETSSQDPSVTITKCESDRQTDHGQDIKAESIDPCVTSDTFHQIQSVDNREAEADVKSQFCFYVDVSSTSVDSWSTVNSERSEMKPSNDSSKMKGGSLTVYTQSWYNTTKSRVQIGFVNTGVKTEPASAHTDDIPTKPTAADIISDVIMTEATIADTISDVIRTETTTANTSSDVIKTEATTADPISDVIKGEPITENTVDDETKPVFTNVINGQEDDRAPSPTCQASGSGQKRCAGDACNKTVTPVRNLKVKPTGLKSYSCDVCGKNFTQASSLRRHKMIHTGLKSYSCDVCSKTFTWTGYLKTHRMIHNGQKPVSCDVCNKIFRHASSLKIHKRTHASEKSFSCNVCSKTFTWACDLKRHKMTHTGEKSFSCDVCSKTFTRAYSLNTHKMIHTGEKSFACDVCSKTFTRAGDLNRHKMTHFDQKSFACDVCSKTFMWECDLKTHKMNHTGQKAFSCDECGKTFAQAYYLKTHKMIHAGQISFACDLCSKTFTWPSSLKAHKMTHTGQKSFACDVCSKPFTRASTLKRHKMIHTGQKSFACDVCGKTFTWASSLKTHKMTHIGQKNNHCM